MTAQAPTPTTGSLTASSTPTTGSLTASSTPTTGSQTTAPSALRTTDTTARHCVIEGALGELTVVADGDGLIGIYFPGHWTNPSTDGWGPRVDAAGDPLLTRAERELDEYLDGERTAFDVPITPRGNTFEHQVWWMLLEIPYGATTTYGALAERLGNKALAQRVGQAVGHNPISVVIPCHRVVGSDGSLTGYAGGLDRKRFLLGLEESDEARSARLF